MKTISFKSLLILMTTLITLSAPAMAGEVPVNLEPETLTEVPNAVLLEENLVSGGAPTARGLGQAAEQGIRTVIDFRDPKEGTAEEKDHTDAIGLKYVNIPVTPGNFSDAQAKQLGDVLKDPATGPALLHCATGQRATAVWALYRNREQGVSADQALADAQAKGLKKPELIAKLKEQLK